MAHIRQSRPDSGLNFQVKVLKTFKMLPLQADQEITWKHLNFINLVSSKPLHVCFNITNEDRSVQQISLSQVYKSQVFPHEILDGGGHQGMLEWWEGLVEPRSGSCLSISKEGK